MPSTVGQQASTQISKRQAAHGSSKSGAPSSGMGDSARRLWPSRSPAACGDSMPCSRRRGSGCERQRSGMACQERGGSCLPACLPGAREAGQNQLSQAASKELATGSSSMSSSPAHRLRAQATAALALALTGCARMGMLATFCMAALTGGRKAPGCMPPYGFSGGICGGGVSGWVGRGVINQ
jgi:hypothetical protein